MTERYVTLAEVRDLLEEVAESRKGTAGLLEDEDVLLASQKAALDHAQKVSTISLEDANKIVEEVSQIEEVTDAIAVKIADILPRYPDDVRAIFSKERINLSNDQINQIIEIVEKYI
ncbi:MAG: RNA polymerase [Thermoplasmata archaeon]|jgi:DNA-directed RNA polymerase subunit F|nr:RNA polymerase [Thermoplasmata archaeon]